MKIGVHVRRRPEVDHADALAPPADAVYAPETLDYLHRVSVNVVVDYAVAIPKILPFGYTVDSDEQVYVRAANHAPARVRGEVGQYGVEPVFADGGARQVARHHRHADAQFVRVAFRLSYR